MKPYFTALLLVLIALASTFASAAPPCYPYISGEPVFTPRVARGDTGTHVFWWCKVDDKVKDYGLSCITSECNAELFGSIAARLSLTGKSGDGAYNENVKYECADVLGEQTPRGALCRERAALLAEKGSVWRGEPPALVWKVKKNGAYPTRPAYSLINGILGTKELARADVGTVCNILKPTAPATNGDIRAEFGIPGVVTICSNSN